MTGWRFTFLSLAAAGFFWLAASCTAGERSPASAPGWTAAPPPPAEPAALPSKTPFASAALPTSTDSVLPTLPASSTPDLNRQSSPRPDQKAMESATPVPATHMPTLMPTATLSADAWKQLPVLPVLPSRIHDIYQKGTAAGNNPRAFAKIGDCESTPTWFLGSFDADTRYYDLGEYAYLSEVIEYYQGSFGRDSVAARRGANVSSILTPLWADPKVCLSGETPLACEYRLMRPSIALITLGTNDVWQMEKFEPRLRQIIEITLQAGIIPVLATKADNLEEDHSINAIIARLSREYDIPLWNFWLAVQKLPARGLQPDGSHLTWAPNFFDRYNLQSAWPVRNLTALQVLDLLKKELDPR